MKWYPKSSQKIVFAWFPHACQRCKVRVWLEKYLVIKLSSALIGPRERVPYCLNCASKKEADRG